MAVLNPSMMPPDQKTHLLETFANITPAPGSGPSLQELGTFQRYAFDLAYLEACGFDNPEEIMLQIERSLRALAGERVERKLSVVNAKVSRRRLTNVSASIDAYASRLVSAVDPLPDPRSYVPSGTPTEPVCILGPVEGDLDVGLELFNQGEVLANGFCIARAGNVLAAQYVRGVLLAQPELERVELPAQSLELIMDEWTRASRIWHHKVKLAADRTLLSLNDEKLRSAVESRALKLAHAN